MPCTDANKVANKDTGVKMPAAIAWAYSDMAKGKGGNK